MFPIKESYNFEKLVDRARYCADLAGNMSQLSQLSGVSRSHVWRIVEGRADMTTEIVSKIADAVGVDPGWLVTGKGKPQTGMHDPSTEEVHLRVFGEEGQTCPIRFTKQFFADAMKGDPDRCYAYQVEEKEILSIPKGNWCVADTELRDGYAGYYLLRAGKATQIRLLEFIPTGAICVRSNQHSAYTLEPDQTSVIEIIGRIIWWEIRAV